MERVETAAKPEIIAPAAAKVHVFVKEEFAEYYEAGKEHQLVSFFCRLICFPALLWASY